MLLLFRYKVKCLIKVFIMLFSKTKKFTLSLIAIFFFTVGSTALAQVPQQELREDFKDKELESFVKASQKVNQIQAEGEAKMVKAIEEEGLTLDRFNEILTNQQNPQKEDDATSEELSSFNNAAQVIMQERQAMQIKMATSIEEEGIDMDTYNMIMYAYQQSPKVQQRIDDLLED